MKKFLAVFDGYKMANNTMEYAIQVTRDSNAHLVGVFLDEFMYQTYNVYRVVSNYHDYKGAMKALDEKDKQKRDESVEKFKVACGKAGIHYSVHRDKSIALQELKQESMFADIIIISEYETFSKYEEQLPTQFIRDLLSDVQCPVFIVPSVFKAIDKIVLLFDGGASAMHAIKMFSYLLGNLQKLPVEVFTVNDKYKGEINPPENKLMKEFLKRHFPKATYTIKSGNSEEQITSWLKDHEENELVVLGAYQRGGLSRYFKPSMADTLMREVDTPLFIAHTR